MLLISHIIIATIAVVAVGTGKQGGRTSRWIARRIVFWTAAAHGRHEQHSRHHGTPPVSDRLPAPRDAAARSRPRSRLAAVDDLPDIPTEFLGKLKLGKLLLHTLVEGLLRVNPFA